MSMAFGAIRFLALGGLVALNSAPAVAQTTWNDVLPQVKQHCAKEWPDDYSMQAYCIKKQRAGWEAVNTDATSAPSEPRNTKSSSASETQSALSSGAAHR
jgi:hypothetical protein